MGYRVSIQVGNRGDDAHVYPQPNQHNGVGQEQVQAEVQAVQEDHARLRSLLGYRQLHPSGDLHERLQAVRAVAGGRVLRAD